MHARHDVMWHRGRVEGEHSKREAKEKALDRPDAAHVELAKVEEELKHLTQLFLGHTSIEDFLSMFDKPRFATRREFQERGGNQSSLWNDDVVTPSSEPLRHIRSSSTSVSAGPSYAHVARAPSLASSSNAGSPPSTGAFRPSHPNQRHLGPGADIPDYYTAMSFKSGVRKSLAALFSAAHNHDAAALAKCKALCTEAHATEPEKKTFGMNFVLTQWRNPSSDPSIRSSSSASSIPASRQTNYRARVAGIPNPRAEDPPEVWLQFLRTHPSNWPIGVRKQSNGDAVLSDLIASRMLAHTRPSLQSSSLLRQQFVNVMLSLFTMKGRYEKLVNRLALKIAPIVKYRPFSDSSRSESISEEDVARHYASCGLTIKMVEENVENWAIEYKLEKGESYS
ncbi:hypothetical protein BT96DRAFT_946946 [Gymnopus androsaceus JB14]|uniref:Uncharacterized protein n=1 Tax=Gymnopus androsaceus JB14 TaxID=1447944 RepID=A0A6A4GW80_9AGAR|nr:hypothetical protein BT96DRAFT_946946 [Gymnopus androsaceus JB14]